MPDNLSIEQIEKIGNAVIYFSTRVSELTKTKLLKLLFLLEEQSIRKYGKPFFGLDFKVWQFGPVVEPIYNELNGEEVIIFKEYFTKNQFDEFESLKDFNDDEFSNNDISLLDELIAFAKHKIARDFVNYTHAPDSLWTKTAKKFGVYEDLENRTITKTNHSIDFSMLFESDPESYVFDKYNTSIENKSFSKNFKELRRV